MIKIKENGIILEGKQEQALAYRLLERKGYEPAEWRYVRTNADGWHVFKCKANSDMRIEI